MAKEELFAPPVDIDAAAAVAAASEAGLYSPEAHSFTTPEQAEIWLNVAARELSGIKDVPGVTAKHYPVWFGGEDRDKPTAFQFFIHLQDEAAEQWVVEGKLKKDREEKDWLSTSIACTTNETDADSYTSAVYRDSGRIDISVPIDGHAYSVSKYEDKLLDGEYKPELTRTEPGELTDEESEAAEKKYIEMVNQFKQLLELKVAETDIDKIVKINQLAEAEMPTHVKSLLEKFHLAKVA